MYGITVTGARCVDALYTLFEDLVRGGESCRDRLGGRWEEDV